MSEPVAATEDLYLDLLERCLTASIYDESSWVVSTGEIPGHGRVKRWFLRLLPRFLSRFKLMLVHHRRYDPAARENGTDWPMFGYSMIGLKRMRHLRRCVETVLAENVPGDLIETGVWRGGACMLMRAVLKKHGDTSRAVWAADSFEGLPPPTAQTDRDHADFDVSKVSFLAVSQEQVQDNFRRFGLLDDQVKFLKGWFRDTLPTAPVEKLSILRLDGDMYESTMDGLRHLYPKLSAGGFVIVDDYHPWPACKKAVDEYRAEHQITAPFVEVDGSAVVWRKPAGG